MSSFADDLFAVAKSRGTVLACGILTSIVTARYLGPEGNGIVATLTVYPSLFMTIGSLGIRQSTAYYIGQGKHDDNEIFSSVLYIWLFTSLFCILSCYFLLKYMTKGNYENGAILLSLSPIPFALLTTYCSGLFLGKNRIKDFNTVNWVPNVVKLAAYVLFIIMVPWDVSGALFGILLGYLVLTFLIWGKIKKMVLISWKFDYTIVKGLLSLGVVYALSLLIISLNYKIDIVLLEKLSTPFEVGIYTKGGSIVEHLWDIPTLLSTIIFARSATAKDARKFSFRVSQLLRICFLVILGISIVFFFLSEFIMTTMYGEQFRGSSDVQKLLLPGILLLTIFKVLNMDLAGKGKPWIAVTAMLPALVINVILNYLWDTKYGANGAALASTISYSVSAILFLHMYSRYVKISIREILTYSLSDFDFVEPLLKKMKIKKA